MNARSTLPLLVVALAACSDVKTYRLAPHMEPNRGSKCGECSVGLTMVATEDGTSPPVVEHFYSNQFENQGFKFRWGVEQVVEITEESIPTRGFANAPNRKYTFVRVVEAKPFTPGTRFEMTFIKAPPGNYHERFLMRTASGLRLGEEVEILCDAAAPCDALAERKLGESAFVLELSFPDEEGAPLRLHAVRELPES